MGCISAKEKKEMEESEAELIAHMQENKTKLCKIVLLGSESAGKTKLVERYAFGSYSSKDEPTIGAGFHNKHHSSNRGKAIHFQIWDTAGNARWKFQSTMYYQNCKMICLVFDSTDPQSLQAALEWHSEVKETASEDTQYLLIATKCDLVDQRAVSSQDEAIQQLVNTPSSHVHYFETSALKDAGVQEVFQVAADLWVSCVVHQNAAGNSDQMGAVKLPAPGDIVPQKK